MEKVNSWNFGKNLDLYNFRYLKSSFFWFFVKFTGTKKDETMHHEAVYQKFQKLYSFETLKSKNVLIHRFNFQLFQISDKTNQSYTILK